MKPLARLIRDKRFRQAVALVVIVATLGAFTYYLLIHPKLIRSIFELDPLTLLFLTLCYVGTIVANAFVLYVSLRLIGKRVGYSENIALTGYSSVVNFFGPLQSGPGFRAAYLKQRHGVSLKRFFYVTVIFYGFFAALNGLVIGGALLARTSGTALLMTVIGFALLFALVIFVSYKNQKLHSMLSSIKLTDSHFWLIGLGALLLSLATASAYYVELVHVDKAINFGQSIVYAAAANLALFVSLTPGAIGFRESFLLLSQQLHDIPSQTVIAASIIDRAFYVVFLLAMFVLLLLFGATRRLKQTQPAQSER